MDTVQKKSFTEVSICDYGLTTVLSYKLRVECYKKNLLMYKEYISGMRE